MEAKETTITLPMGNADVREATMTVIEHLAITPPDFSQMSEDRLIYYTMGIEVLFECLRATFSEPKRDANG